MPLHEFDVRPLEPADFDRVGEDYEVFVAFTKLGVITARILDVYARRSEMPSQQVRPESIGFWRTLILTMTEDATTSILSSLKEWVNELPDSSRLYDPSRTRRVYRRDVYEIHICYFAMLITFFHLCGQDFDSSSTNMVSLVASSCIAQLYEEIDFRDDVNYLMSPNNWYLMVACAPQLHYAGGEHDQDKSCTRDLNILVAVIQLMCLKWRGAKNILDTVLRLSTPSMESSLSPQLLACKPAAGKETGRRTPTVRLEHPHGLFPFPNSMCPRMNLLDRVVDLSWDANATQLAPSTDEDLISIFDVFGSNIFNMPIDSF